MTEPEFLKGYCGGTVKQVTLKCWWRSSEDLRVLCGQCKKQILEGIISSSHYYSVMFRISCFKFQVLFDFILWGTQFNQSMLAMTTYGNESIHSVCNLSMYLNMTFPFSVCSAPWKTCSNGEWFVEKISIMALETFLLSSFQSKSYDKQLQQNMLRKCLNIWSFACRTALQAGYSLFVTAL